MRVLVVDDEARLASSLKAGLEAEGFAVDVATRRHRRAVARQGARVRRDRARPDAARDQRLPGLRRRLRAEKNWTPILMLTAKDGEWDQVEGLDTGADDYLTKPFSFPVLVARLRAVARRGARERPTQLEAGDLRLDPAARRAWRGDVELELTAREFSLLGFLVRHRGDVVSKRQHPRGRVGRRLRRGPEHRRGLRPPPAQQDRPAVRSRGDRDPAGCRLPARERRWLTGRSRLAAARPGPGRAPRSAPYDGRGGRSWWPWPCWPGRSRWSRSCGTHCATGSRPAPPSAPRPWPTRSRAPASRCEPAATTTASPWTPTSPRTRSGR